jgi:hypothetical protein
MDSDLNTREESQRRQQPEETIALNYIDKVYASLVNQWGAVARSFTVQTLVSLLTLSVCIGAVTPQEKFSLLGLGVNASITTVLIGCAFLIATFHAMALSAITRARDVRFVLIDLYENIKYRPQSMEVGSSGDPLGPTSPLYSLVYMSIADQGPQSWFSRAYVNVVGFTIVIGVVFVLPIVAELAACIKVASLESWEVSLLWAVFAIPIIVSGASVVRLLNTISQA